MLRITARSIANEFDARGVEYEIVDEDKSIIRYKNKGSWHYIRSSLCEYASPVGVSIADNKRVSRVLAKEIGLRTPDEFTISPSENGKEFLIKYKQLVVKPSDAAHGNGVTTEVESVDQLTKAVGHARDCSPSNTVIVQEMIDGYDIRVLVVGHKFAAAAQRLHASVTGDGKATTRGLIVQENAQNDSRGENYTKLLNYIDLEAAIRYLGDEANTKPDKNEVVRVVGTANIGTGGESKDITAKIPKAIQQKAIEYADRLSLPVCAVDFITSDIAREDSYTFIEANACPSFGLHLQPTIGNSQPVDILFVDYLMEKS